MDKNEILQQVILNNSVKDYLIFISLVLTGLIFRKLISKSISHFVFRLLNKNNEIDIKAFNSFLVKPLSFFPFFT